jgi:hypothetical protein
MIIRDLSNSAEDNCHKMRVDFTASEIVIYDFFVIPGGFLYTQ